MFGRLKTRCAYIFGSPSRTDSALVKTTDDFLTYGTSNMTCDRYKTFSESCLSLRCPDFEQTLCWWGGDIVVLGSVLGQNQLTAWIMYLHSSVRQARSRRDSHVCCEEQIESEYGTLYAVHWQKVGLGSDPSTSPSGKKNTLLLAMTSQQFDVHFGHNWYDKLQQEDDYLPHIKSSCHPKSLLTFVPLLM